MYQNNQNQEYKPNKLKGCLYTLGGFVLGALTMASIFYSIEKFGWDDLGSLPEIRMEPVKTMERPKLPDETKQESSPLEKKTETETEFSQLEKTTVTSTQP